jgi:hypothetical protein
MPMKESASRPWASVEWQALILRSSHRNASPYMYLISACRHVRAFGSVTGAIRISNGRRLHVIGILVGLERDAYSVYY